MIARRRGRRPTKLDLVPAVGGQTVPLRFPCAASFWVARDHDAAENRLMAVMPMLADFAVRLGFGLCVAVFIVSWRTVPVPFFRTQLQVVLGLVVLAALDQARHGGPPLASWLLVAAALLAYLSAATWGLGLPLLGQGTGAACALILLGRMAGSSWSSSTGLAFLNASSRAASGFLLGVTLSAMLLGHYYLTAPAMSIEPLKRMVAFMAWALGARSLLATIGFSMTYVRHSGFEPVAGGDNDSLFLAARWGMGFVGAAVAIYLAWRTAGMRSTQSATGILYIAIIFILFGELTSLVMAGRQGVLC
jgi:hypothetical protein